MNVRFAATARQAGMSACGSKLPAGDTSAGQPNKLLFDQT